MKFYGRFLMNRRAAIDRYTLLVASYDTQGNGECILSPTHKENMAENLSYHT